MLAVKQVLDARGGHYRSPERRHRGEGCLIPGAGDLTMVIARRWAVTRRSADWEKKEEEEKDNGEQKDDWAVLEASSCELR
eukprot:6802018-Heterocapsa_arctica.AAC.1